MPAAARWSWCWLSRRSTAPPRRCTSAACCTRPSPGTNSVLVTTTVYALVTAGTRNAALVLAAVVMGFIFARQRRVAGGLLAPVVTHLAWSLLMVLLLPR